MPVKRPEDESEVDLESLAKEFPDVDFSDVFNELFGRRGHRFHRNLERKYQAPAAQRRSKTVPITAYQSVFGKKHRVRPRSTKRPPPTPRNFNPPPMVCHTEQRDNYTPKDVSNRPGMIIMGDNHELSDSPFDGTTIYQKQYPEKFTLPEINTKQSNEGRHLKSNSAKFDSRTTSKEHYKQWISQPSITFGELPSFAGSIIYPEKTKVPNSTMKSSYPGAYAAKLEPVRCSEGNLKLEGDLNHDTTNNLTYRSFDGAKPAKKVIHKPEISLQKRGKFNAETQNKSDYPGYSSQTRHEARPRPATPPPATVQIGFNNSLAFDTEQRSTYRGHDIREHPVPKTCKKDDDDYVPPTQKFETLTSQKIDYQPIDVKAAYQPPVPVPKPKLAKESPKFDSNTTVKEHFKEWVPQPSITFGELPSLAGSILYPEKTKVPESTTVSTYRGKLGPKAEPAPGREVNLKVEGDMDLITTNNVTYGTPKLKVSKSQANLIREELARRRKHQIHPINQPIVA